MSYAPAIDLADRESLASQFHGYMHQIARRMLSAGTPLDRSIGDEDLGQEIAVNAFRWHHRFDSFRGKYVTWLWQVAWSTVYECRYHATRPVRAACGWRAERSDRLLATRDPKALPPDRRVAAADFWAAVADKLDDRERRIVEMRFREGRELRDIGSDLGVTRRTANKLYLRALNKLRPYGEYLREVVGTN